MRVESINFLYLREDLDGLETLFRTKKHFIEKPDILIVI